MFFCKYNLASNRDSFHIPIQKREKQRFRFFLKWLDFSMWICSMYHVKWGVWLTKKKLRLITPKASHVNFPKGVSSTMTKVEMAKFVNAKSFLNLMWKTLYQLDGANSTKIDHSVRERFSIKFYFLGIFLTLLIHTEWGQSKYVRKL